MRRAEKAPITQQEKRIQYGRADEEYPGVPTRLGKARSLKSGFLRPVEKLTREERKMGHGQSTSALPVAPLEINRIRSVINLLMKGSPSWNEAETRWRAAVLDRITVPRYRRACPAAIHLERFGLSGR